MSNAKRTRTVAEEAIQRVEQEQGKLSDSVMIAPARLAGIARTVNGWCQIEVEISADGKLTQVELGVSEVYPQFVVARSKDRQRKLALAAQANASVPRAALKTQTLTSKGRVW